MLRVGMPLRAVSLLRLTVAPLIPHVDQVGDTEQLILANVGLFRQHLAALEALRRLKQFFRGTNSDFLHLDRKTRS